MYVQEQRGDSTGSLTIFQQDSSAPRTLWGTPDTYPGRLQAALLHCYRWCQEHFQGVSFFNASISTQLFSLARLVSI